ncbi:ExbD/TolR family protein [Taibaiella lutea]|nr:biopolymer transporter ExbD [Taibaiella lutea]
MAQILLKSDKGGRSKAAPRIDLTPMVDLGFLLITFFMLTTTMSKSNVMDIQMPAKVPVKSPTTFYESSAITLLPAANHYIYYYEGIFNPNNPLKMAKDIADIRNILQHKKALLKNRTKVEERDLQVLIKANSDATCSDIVALFDEMNISSVKYYAMVDISKEETALISQDNRPF